MSGLPQLATDGNRIIRRDTGQIMLLRGVNRSGLEYSEPAGNDFLRGAGIDEAEIRHITREWGANIIRLPFNQDRVLNGFRTASPEDYMGALDRVIEWAARSGAYTLLDLQWIDTDVRIAPLPDSNSQTVWRILAQRYRDQPSVLFDLYNEPHDVSADLWRFWANTLLGVIREQHPDAVIFVSGTDWGYDLRSVTLNEPGVVYSTHVYPWKVLAWDEAFGAMAKDIPVFAGEWGGHDEHLAWGEELAQYLEDLGLGWTAWSWADSPHLISRDGNPTVFGELVKRLLNFTRRGVSGL